MCSVDQISVETAQPNVDPAVFRRLPDKTIILGVIDLSDDAPVESPEQVAARIAPRSSTCHRKGSWSPRTAG